MDFGADVSAVFDGQFVTVYLVTPSREDDRSTANLCGYAQCLPTGLFLWDAADHSGDAEFVPVANIALIRMTAGNPTGEHIADKRAARLEAFSAVMAEQAGEAKLSEDPGQVAVAREALR